MTVDVEIFTELTHSMMYAVARQELTINQASIVLFSCAQPSTTVDVIDLTRQARAALDDWSQESKGRLIAVEAVRVRFDCMNVHGECKKGEHHVMMTRILGTAHWSPDSVVSTHDFEQTILNLTIEQHPSGDDEKFVVSRSRASGLAGAFAEMFGQEAETIDDKVNDFRAELDALFPSNPPPGKEEDHESS